MSKRIEYFDLAKGFCIFLVVWFHVFEFYGLDLPIDYFFKSFRMPLYFILSGCFFKTYLGFNDFVRRKLNKLFIPFLFFYITTSIILPIILYELFDIQLQWGDQYYKTGVPYAYWGKEHFPNIPIWFLLCLFQINIVFYCIMLLGNITKKTNLTIISCTTIIGAMGLACSHYNIKLPFFIDTCFSAIPFFVFGYYIYRHTNILMPNRLDRYIPFFILFMGGGLLFLSHNCTFRFLSNIFNNKALLVLYPCGIIGSLCIFFLAKYVKKLPMFSYYGRYSIMILVSHQLVYQVFAYVLSFFDFHIKIIAIANTILTLSVYVFIIPFMLKYMPYVTAQKDVITPEITDKINYAIQKLKHN